MRRAAVAVLSMSDTNRQIRLAARPQGELKPSDWEHVDEPLREPGEGEFAGQTKVISLDPAMRGWINDAQVLRPAGRHRRGHARRRRSSRSRRPITPSSRSATTSSGSSACRRTSVSDGKGALKVDPSVAPLPTYLGALGHAGHDGLLRPARRRARCSRGRDGAWSPAPRARSARWSARSPRSRAARVVGIAGGPEKCALLTDELGFDAAIDYRAEDVKGALRAATPDRIDVYFDNVGGDILDLALARLSMKARVVICGAISQYNNEPSMQGPSNYMSLLVNRARMEGFVVFDYAKRYREAAARDRGLDRRGQGDHQGARGQGRDRRLPRDAADALPR